MSAVAGSAAEFFAASNVLIVAGKGGVGKTTVGATIGVAAAQAGCDTLLVELEGYSNLGALVGMGALGYDEVEIPVEVGPGGGRLRARQIEPDSALTDYLDRAGIGPITSRLTTAGAIDVVATAAPGIRDLLALGKIRQLEQSGDADLIVVDAPAAGHALTFLTAAAGLSASTTSGPIRQQADLVLEMFADDRRCQVMLVTLPEETAVTEAVETAYSLEEEVGIKLAPVVINGLWSEVEGLADAVDRAGAAADGEDNRLVPMAELRLARMANQRSEIDRLAGELPLPQFTLPFLFRSDLGLPEVETLATAVLAQVPPQMVAASDTPAKPIPVSKARPLADDEAHRPLVNTIGDSRIVLCLGSGGVGKTTMSAALAVALAHGGERVVVLTIDPARRLADALGRHGELMNEATLVEPPEGLWSGELWAAMLDPAATLEGIVRAEADSPERTERILNNPLFRNLTTSLSGTSEYVASERLHQLAGDDRFDRIIVDTPPSRHVMDFLDSPGRLTRFVDHRLYRSVLAPRHRLLRSINTGTQLVIRLLARLVGAGLVDDVIAFFSDFEGLDEGFRRRAADIDALLSGPDTAYVLVTAAKKESLQEAEWILGNLERRDRSADAVVVNRRLVADEADGSGDGPLQRNHRELRSLADGERILVERLRGTVTELSDRNGTLPTLVEVPEQVTPVRDLGDLARLSQLL